MEVAVLGFFQSIRNPFLTAFFGIFSFPGEGLPLALFLACACLLFPEKGKRLLVAAALSLCLNCALKSIFARPRPYAAGESTLLPVDTLFLSTVNLDGFSSFPSGHAQMTAALFTAFFLLQPRTWVFICALIPPFFTALSRLYFGVHYPTDVIAGLFLGTVAGGAAGFIERNRGALFLCAAAAIFTLFFISSREYVASVGLLFGIAVFLPACAQKLEFPVCRIRPALRLFSGAFLTASIAMPVLLFPQNSLFLFLCPFLLAGVLTCGAQTLFRILCI